MSIHCTHEVLSILVRSVGLQPGALDYVCRKLIASGSLDSAALDPFCLELIAYIVVELFGASALAALTISVATVIVTEAVFALHVARYSLPTFFGMISPRLMSVNNGKQYSRDILYELAQIYSTFTSQHHFRSQRVRLFLID